MSEGGREHGRKREREKEREREGEVAPISMRRTKVREEAGDRVEVAGLEQTLGAPHLEVLDRVAQQQLHRREHRPLHHDHLSGDERASISIHRTR